MKFSIGERVVSLTGGKGEWHEGVIVRVSAFADGTPMYHVKRDFDGFVYVAQEDWIASEMNKPALPGPLWSSGISQSGLTLHDSAPKSPQVGDTWIDASGGSVHVYAGGGWMTIGAASITRPDLEPDLNEDERRYLRESLGLDEETEL